MNQPRPLYQFIAECLTALPNAENSGNHGLVDRWKAALAQCDGMLPRGDGFDNGSVIVKAESDGNKIVIATSYHHVENGYYDGWTEHRVTVRPSLAHGIDLSVSGRDRNEVKGYIAETFGVCLRREIDPAELIGPGRVHGQAPSTIEKDGEG